LSQRALLAEFYARSGNPNKAVETYQQILQADPGNRAVKLGLASVYMEQRAYDRAAQLGAEMLKDNRADVAAQLLRGRILLAQTKVTDAIRELQSVADANKSSAAARYSLGLAYLQDRRSREAETEWTAALKVNSGFVQAYSDLAALKLDLGDPDQAIRY